MERDLNSLIGENMVAIDGVIGKVEGFYFDAGTWTIRSLIVKTGTWLAGRKVLLPTETLIKHSWASGVFRVNLTEDQVRGIPDLDSGPERHEKSYGEVVGYQAQASDGAIGQVSDFIMNDQTWKILYLVVETRDWAGGKKVLIGIPHIKEAQWDKSTIVADTTIDVIRNGVPADLLA